jgi:hypothetical protein
MLRFGVHFSGGALSPFLLLIWVLVVLNFKEPPK